MRHDGTPLDRFNATHKVDPNGCWIWQGAPKGNGYGQWSVGPRRVYPHRWAYENFVGPIPDGYDIDHLCHVRMCVNPAHLEAVTHQENVRRRVARKTHCVNGHEYTPENTYWWTDGARYSCRFCRTCRAGHHDAAS